LRHCLAGVEERAVREISNLCTYLYFCRLYIKTDIRATVSHNIRYLFHQYMLHVSVVLIISNIKYMIFKTPNKMRMDFKFVKSQIKSIYSYAFYFEF